MLVRADRGVRVSAKMVSDLPKLTTWPENLVIATPEELHSESAVKISKASRRVGRRKAARRVLTSHSSRLLQNHGSCITSISRDQVTTFGCLLGDLPAESASCRPF